MMTLICKSHLASLPVVMCYMADQVFHMDVVLYNLREPIILQIHDVLHCCLLILALGFRVSVPMLVSS